MKKPGERKTENVALRVTPKEKDFIDAAAESIGLSTSAFLKQAILQYLRLIKAEKAILVGGRLDEWPEV